MPSLKIKRGTRAQITSAAAASGLRVGELYHVTDEGRVELGTAVGASVALANKSELLSAGVAESGTTAVTYTYTGVFDIPPVVAPPAGFVAASPTGKERVGSLLISQFNKRVTGVEFPELEHVESAFSPNLSAATSFSLPALTTVRGSFSPLAAAVTTLNAPVLTTISGTCNVASMVLLTTLSMPALEAIGDSFSTSGGSMTALTTVDLSSLTTVGVNFNPSNMSALTTLDLPSLTTVVGIFAPSTMGALTTLNLPALATVGSFSPGAMGLLTTLNVPVLANAYMFNPTALASLTTLSLPSLTHIGTHLGMSSMTALTTISIPVIERIGTAVASGSYAIDIVTKVAALTTLELPATLKQVGMTGAHVRITSAALNQASVDSILVRLAALDGTNGTTAFSTRTVTITGTSSAPSATGLAAKATLVARGCTVTHN